MLDLNFSSERVIAVWNALSDDSTDFRSTAHF